MAKGSRCESMQTNGNNFEGDNLTLELERQGKIVVGAKLRKVPRNRRSSKDWANGMDPRSSG